MNENPKPVAIFDTGIVLQAAINPAGPAGSALDQFDRGAVTVYLSPRLRSEWEDVLMRPSLCAKNPQIMDAQVEAALLRFDARALIVPNPPTYLIYPRDPDHNLHDLAAFSDSELTELARKYGARYIVIDRTHAARRVGLPRLYPTLVEENPSFEVYWAPEAAKP